MMVHHEAHFLQTVVVLFVIGTALAYALRWLRMPTVFGFILTGCAIGPYGLRLIADPSLIDSLAQIGVLFLLFMVGVELSIDKMKTLRVQAPVVGGLQLSLTAIALTACLWLLGFPVQYAFLIGAILSLSSTAIVLKSLEETGDMNTAYGRLILAVLIIQDISIVPLMTMVPVFTAPLNAGALVSVGVVFLKALLFLGLTVLFSLRVIPALLDRLAMVHHREVFTLSVVTLGLAMAWVTGAVGLSFEAGAFIAGFSLSGSLYSRQVLVDSRPFRDVFAALFFVSVGLLVDVDALLQHGWLVMGITLLILVVKGLCAATAALLGRFSLKTALWTGCALFQVGEFSFVLLRRTFDAVALSGVGGETVAHLLYWEPLLVNAVVISMFVTPLVLKAIPVMLQWWLRRQSGGILPEELPEESGEEQRVIIGGYGPIARNVAQALSREQVPYVVIEMNAATVKKLKQEGVPCVFGDVSQGAILSAAGITSATLFVLTFPDIRTAEAAIQKARQLSPRIRCIARAQYRIQADRLYQVGAHEVVHEEFEAGLRFISAALYGLGKPRALIQQEVELVRVHQEQADGDPVRADETLHGRLSILADTKIEWISLSSESPLVGKSLAESRIRQYTGVNILSIIDGEAQKEVRPSPERQLKSGDVLVAMGTLTQLQDLERFLSAAGD